MNAHGRIVAVLLGLMFLVHLIWDMAKVEGMTFVTWAVSYGVERLFEGTLTIVLMLLCWYNTRK